MKTLKLTLTILTMMTAITSQADVYVIHGTPANQIRTSGQVHYVPAVGTVDLSRAQALTASAQNLQSTQTRIAQVQATTGVAAASQANPPLTPAQIQGINNTVLYNYAMSQTYSGFASLPVDPITGIPNNPITDRIIATQILR